MTALTIIRTLQANKNAILWLNRDRRQAALSGHDNSGVCAPVDFNEAIVAKTDTNLRLVEESDGEIYKA